MSDKFTAETCCNDWDSLVDAPECKDCPARQHYLHSKMTPETPAKVTATTLPDEPLIWEVEIKESVTGLTVLVVPKSAYDALLQSFNAERLRAELAEKLGMRICRDLRHAIDEIADGNEAKALMRTRHAAFEKMIGDTSNYRHELHASIDAANERAETMAKNAGRYRKIGWAQKMHEGKLLLMETSLPKEDLHDNGREMYPLFIYDAAIDTAIEQGAQHG